ncbi:MAG: hypothetical protein ACPGWR_02085 [Ardenticatenaceae bacterium]
MALVSKSMLRLPRSLWLILVVYVILAALYATITPIFEKPDENWHFAFSMYVVETGQLPVQTLTERDHLAEQEGSQPPLYYALLAGLLKISGLDELGEGFAQLTEKNPYYGVRAGAWRDNANQFVHGFCLEACWRTAQAVYLGRALSILSGVLALLAAGVTLHLAFPKREGLLLGVVGVMAFNPQFLHISSSVSNDVLTVTFVNVAFALALMTRSNDFSRLGWGERLKSLLPVGHLVALGVVVGLATLSKPSGLSIVVTIGLWILFSLLRSPVSALGSLLFYSASFLAISGWWFVRNWRLYGEPTGTAIHLQVYGVPAPLLTWSTFQAEWKAVANTFWASFGWGAINPSNEIYTAVQLLLLLLTGLFVVTLLRHWREWSEPPRFLVGFSIFHLLLVGMLLFRWMRLTVAPLGRLLFPAQLPISLILVLGLLTLAPRRVERPAMAVFVSGWAAIALFFLITLIRPAYTPPPLLTTLPEGAHPLHVQFGDQMVLEGYDAPAGALHPGDLVPITLYWRALQPIDEQLSIAIKLFGRDEQLLAENNSYPDGGRAPTRSWRPQQLITDRTTLLLSRDAHLPTRVGVEIDVFRLDANLSRLPPIIDGQPVRPMRPFSLVVREADDTPTAPATFRFRSVTEQIMVRNGMLEADIIWEVGQPLDGDYQAFFHLSSAIDQPPLVPADFPPLGGHFPTSYWQPGDRLPDHAQLSLPADPEKGDYLLLLGLYDLTTAQRLTGEGAQDVWILARLRWDGRSWEVINEE